MEEQEYVTALTEAYISTIGDMGKGHGVPTTSRLMPVA